MARPRGLWALGLAGLGHLSELVEVAGFDHLHKGRDHPGDGLGLALPEGFSRGGRHPRCFCCFCRKLAAIDIAFAAEILERGRRGGAKNSGYQRASPLFTRCKLAKVIVAE